MTLWVCVVGLTLKQIKRASDRITGTYKTYSPLISRKKQRKFEEQQDTQNKVAKKEGEEEQEQEGEEGLRQGGGGEEESFSQRAEFLRQRLVAFGFVEENDTELADEAKRMEDQGLVKTKQHKKALMPQDVDKFGKRPTHIPPLKLTLWSLTSHLYGRLVQLRAEDGPKIEYGKVEAVAYVASRFPSVFGVISKVMAEIQKRLPDFKPDRMLDYGTGPGTGIWAAHYVFDGIREFTGVDLSEQMLKVAEDLNYDYLNHKILNVKFQSYLPAKKVSQDPRDSSKIGIVLTAPSSSSSSPSRKATTSFSHPTA